MQHTHPQHTIAALHNQARTNLSLTRRSLRKLAPTALSQITAPKRALPIRSGQHHNCLSSPELNLTQLIVTCQHTTFPDCQTKTILIAAYLPEVSTWYLPKMPSRSERHSPTPLAVPPASIIEINASRSKPNASQYSTSNSHHQFRNSPR